MTIPLPIFINHRISAVEDEVEVYTSVSNHRIYTIPYDYVMTLSQTWNCFFLSHAHYQSQLV